VHEAHEQLDNRSLFRELALVTAVNALVALAKPRDRGFGHSANFGGFAARQYLFGLSFVTLRFVAVAIDLSGYSGKKDPNSQQFLGLLRTSSFCFDSG
jgi:hypothetical protein